MKPLKTKSEIEAVLSKTEQEIWKAQIQYICGHDMRKMSKSNFRLVRNNYCVFQHEAHKIAMIYHLIKVYEPDAVGLLRIAKTYDDSPFLFSSHPSLLANKNDPRYINFSVLIGLKACKRLKTYRNKFFAHNTGLKQTDFDLPSEEDIKFLLNRAIEIFNAYAEAIGRPSISNIMTSRNLAPSFATFIKQNPFGSCNKCYRPPSIHVTKLHHFELQCNCKKSKLCYTYAEAIDEWQNMNSESSLD